MPFVRTFHSVPFGVSLKLNCHSQRKRSHLLILLDFTTLTSRAAHNTFFHIKLSVRMARQCAPSESLAGWMATHNKCYYVSRTMGTTTRMARSNGEGCVLIAAIFFNNKKIWKTRENTFLFHIFLGAAFECVFKRCVRWFESGLHEAHELRVRNCMRFQIAKMHKQTFPHFLAP